MINKINKIYLYLFFFLITIPFYFYLFNTKRNKYLSNLYFNSPVNYIKKRICTNYDPLLDKYLDKTFSLTLIDEKGRIISQYNPLIARVPASNMKLLSTGYVISNYEYFETLRTNLYKDNKDIYYLKGSADPDLLLRDIQKLIDKINFSNIININLLEIDEDIYWPIGWTSEDKLYKYGSPITKLAINSNASRYLNIYFLKNYIYNYLLSKFPKSRINVNIKKGFNLYKSKAVLIDSISSNTIFSLLTLANAESHNFTAESLFKNASNTWESNDYSKLFKWLSNRGFPMKNVYIADASGLSRDNNVTSELLASFLHKMKFNKNYEIYSSSLSIMGIRGTLANTLVDSKLKGKFFGKTGTLSNTFSLSGYLHKKDKIYSISIIQNSKLINKNKVFNLLNDLYEIKACK
tara:strand:+ start:2669 stop:3889 length:1221 start_codon:yes stop_codon:yes gene_type:complete